MMTKIYFLALMLALTLALSPSVQAQSADATSSQSQGQGQGQIQTAIGQGQTQNASASQGQGQSQAVTNTNSSTNSSTNSNTNANTSSASQGQGISNKINSGQVNITTTSEAPHNFAVPYQLYPPGLAVDFGNGNTYGNFVKVPGAFILRKRFSRSELEIMSHARGTCVKFRSWGGEREGAKSPTDYVDFVWELPRKQSVGADGKPMFDEKGQPVMAGYTPDTWTQLGTGTASVTNGDADTYSLIAQYGLYCLDTGKCNMVFFVGEGLKTFVRAWGWNLSAGYTNASVSSNGEHSGIGGIGAGFAYAKTGRLADPWLQGHFIYDSAAQPQQ
jgi:hypothetical protein